MQQLCPPGGHILVSEPENKLLQYIMLDGERCLRETEAGEGISLDSVTIASTGTRHGRAGGIIRLEF